MATFQQTVEELTSTAYTCLTDLYQDGTDDEKRELESVVNELKTMADRAQVPDAVENKWKFWIGLALVIAVYINANVW